MKRNIAIAVWFLGVAIVALMLFGCVTKPYQRPDCPYGEPRFEPLEPLPPLKLHDLRLSARDMRTRVQQSKRL